MEKDEKSRKAIVHTEIAENALKASLSYKVLHAEKDRTWVKIELHTGRFHQIRASFSYIGHPIVGDSKYGSHMKYKEGEISLCATELSFKTATGDNEIKLSLPVEEVFHFS